MTFDAVVLVSTGSDMDPLETMLNIKDLAKSLPIFIIRPSVERDAEQEKRFTYVEWCCVSELQSLLERQLTAL